MSQPKPVGPNDPAFARSVVRSVLFGTAGCFVVTTLLCLSASQGLAMAVSIAVLPALFAGPFVGGLGLVIGYQLRQP
jgi:hypothetical protein